MVNFFLSNFLCIFCIFCIFFSVFFCISTLSLFFSSFFSVPSPFYWYFLYYVNLFLENHVSSAFLIFSVCKFFLYIFFIFFMFWVFFILRSLKLFETFWIFSYSFCIIFIWMYFSFNVFCFLLLFSCCNWQTIFVWPNNRLFLAVLFCSGTQSALWLSPLEARGGGWGNGDFFNMHENILKA